jgi:hypothetical protein
MIMPKFNVHDFIFLKMENKKIIWGFPFPDKEYIPNK